MKIECLKTQNGNITQQHRLVIYSLQFKVGLLLLPTSCLQVWQFEVKDIQTTDTSDLCFTFTSHPTLKHKLWPY